jgi:hypothetical protein
LRLFFPAHGARGLGLIRPNLYEETQYIPAFWVRGNPVGWCRGIQLVELPVFFFVGIVLANIFKHTMAHSQHELLVQEMEREILDYLARHPAAADHRDAIFAYWIMRERFSRGLNALDDALASLVRRGELERINLPDDNAIYRAPRQ